MVKHLNERRVESIRQAVAARDSALVDLELAPRARKATRWAKDRVRDVVFANNHIARCAAAWGYDPAELIAKCVEA